MRHGQPYQPFYCEENIWQLALRSGDPRSVVLVVLNERGAFAMWEQSAAPEGGPVVWDYHVVLTRPAGERSWEVWDLDTRLGCPVPAQEWLSRSFPPALQQVPELMPRFRWVSAERYLSRFSSDRSHMRAQDGSWGEPPPPWPRIQQGASNLGRLRDPADDFLGPVLSLQELAERLRMRVVGNGPARTPVAS